MTPAHPRIDPERLRRDVEALTTIARQADLGLYRMVFSEGDWVAREWHRQRRVALRNVDTATLQPLRHRAREE